MSELHETEAALKEAVDTARANKQTLPSKGDSWGVDLTGAYRIQSLRFRGKPLKGYKLGLLSPAKQEQMNIDQPTYGRITSDMLLDGVIRLKTYLQPRVEPEVAAVLNRELPAGSDVRAAAAAIGGYFTAVDVLDSVWQDYRFTAAEVVADNTSGGGFLLDTRLLTDPPTGDLELHHNGELRSSGSVGVLGDLTSQLCELAKRVGGLFAGQVVFFGSPAAAVPLQAGVLEVVSNTGVLTVPVEDR